jgi:hypothetical protein
MAELHHQSSFRRALGNGAFPVDPITLADERKITVVAKPARVAGVSGMFMRVGQNYGIAYAAHIDNLSFQHFSIAHELGHYYLPGHIDAVLRDGDIHDREVVLHRQTGTSWKPIILQRAY